MNYREFIGKSFNDIQNDEIDNEDEFYGGIEKIKNIRIKNNINKKKIFNKDLDE